ncbi:MAG: hypothetical protein LCH41_14930 [Armatimonadetes bacterium]|nr:hypothetical protein [Armatimonadota bacterium]
MKTYTLVVAALCATLAHAQVIRNGSFEDPGFDLGSGAVTLNDIPQWSLSDSSGVEQTAGVQIFPYNPFFPAPAANGRQALFLSGRTVAQRLTATVIGRLPGGSSARSALQQHFRRKLAHEDVRRRFH